MKAKPAGDRLSSACESCSAAAAIRDPRPLIALVALATAFAAAAFGGSARAATYKWVDEKGVVHYTDKIPSEALNKGSTVLDKQARPVKKIDPTATPEQVRAREAEEENRRLNARATEEIARRDRALISSYTTEAEIDLARTRGLGTIDAQIESSQAYTEQLTKRRVELEKRKAELAGKPMPVALEREFEGNDSEMEKTVALIEQKRRERANVVARYDADKARWRELKSIAESNNAAAAAASPRVSNGVTTTSGAPGASASPRK